MKAIHYMILLRDYAHKFAGKVVSEMIKQGANKQVMREHGIPKSVADWVLGSRCWNKMTVEEAARECVKFYRSDYLF